MELSLGRGTRMAGKMKTIFHCGYDGKPIEDWYGDCVFDNLAAPVVRDGGAPFKSCYDIEWSYHVSNLVDPSRSIAKGAIGLLSMNHDTSSWWPVCDCLFQLCRDFGLDLRQPSRTERLAFWTMFPQGTADCLAESYMKRTGFLEKHRGVPLVLNNPFFHADKNATDRRLVEIAEDDGFLFALDRTKYLPKPQVLADEIALLNHGFRQPEAVASIVQRLTPSIAETMSDWGLSS